MLTSAGEFLIKDARNVINAAHVFEESAKALCDPFSGELHLGLIPTLAPYLLPHIMKDLTARLSQINFYLHEDKTQVLLSKLSEGELDVLVLPWLDEMKNFDRYDLFREPFILTTPHNHELSKQPKLDFDALAGHRILTLEDGHCLRDQAMGYCFNAGATEDQRFRATSLETLRYMVAANMGITLLPQLAAINRSNDNLDYISFTHPVPSRQISLVIRKSYPRMKCIREVVSSIKTSVKGLFNDK